MITQHIGVLDPEGNIYRSIKPAVTQYPRSTISFKKGKELTITIEAKDPIALKATKNTITTALDVITKVKRL